MPKSLSVEPVLGAALADGITRQDVRPIRDALHIVRAKIEPALALFGESALVGESERGVQVDVQRQHVAVGQNAVDLFCFRELRGQRLPAARPGDELIEPGAMPFHGALDDPPEARGIARAEHLVQIALVGDDGRFGAGDQLFEAVI